MSVSLRTLSDPMLSHLSSPIGSEAVFSLSYFFVALGLLLWNHRKNDLPHRPLLLLLAGVLGVGAAEHGMHLWALRHGIVPWLAPAYTVTEWLTAVGSIGVLISLPKTTLPADHASVERIHASMAREISVRESVEEALERNRRFLTSVLENLPHMIFVKSADDLRFVRINQAGLDLLGQTSEEMIGKNDYDLFPVDQADFFTEKDRMVLNGKGLVDIPEEPIRTKHKGLRYLHTKKIPILDAIGHPMYLLGISEDITERKEASEKLRQAYDDLEHRSRELSVANDGLEAFSYSVSHDLRAPLRAIEGFAKILLEEQSNRLDPEGQRLLDIIRRNTLHMSKLIDDLLAFSRIGIKNFAKQWVDIRELVQAVVNDTERSAKRPFAITIHALPPAWADPGLLRQVWVNLISNAIKFSKPGEPPTIEIGSESYENEVRYYVKDQGVGFDMKYIDKLFGVFQRLHSAEEFEGTGVGLAIVQRIIHKHGGRVWADSRPEDGTVFSFTLPTVESLGGPLG